MQAVVDTLKEHGIEAVEVQEDGSVLVEVPEDDMHALVGEIATWLAERGLPFVTEEIDGRIVIRPPAT